MTTSLATLTVLGEIQTAKSAVNHAQVILAASRGVPQDVTVDEGDGSVEAVELARSYAALCEAEIALGKK